MGIARSEQTAASVEESCRYGIYSRSSRTKHKTSTMDVVVDTLRLGGWFK
jgi:hypothetical protein